MFPSFWAVALNSNHIFVHSVVMVATMKKPRFFLGFFMVFRNAMHQCPADLYLKNDLKIALKTTQKSIPNR